MTSAITTANRDTMPILSSDQARDRVRGIATVSLRNAVRWNPQLCGPGSLNGSRQERAKVAVPGGSQLGGVALEGHDALLQHEELGLVRLLFAGRPRANLAPFGVGFVRGH